MGQRDLHFCVTKILHGIKLESNFEPIWHNGIERVNLKHAASGVHMHFRVQSLKLSGSPINMSTNAKLLDAIFPMPPMAAILNLKMAAVFIILHTVCM